MESEQRHSTPHFPILTKRYFKGKDWSHFNLDFVLSFVRMELIAPPWDPRALLLASSSFACVLQYVRFIFRVFSQMLVYGFCWWIKLPWSLLADVYQLQVSDSLGLHIKCFMFNSVTQPVITFVCFVFFFFRSLSILIKNLRKHQAQFTWIITHQASNQDMLPSEMEIMCFYHASGRWNIVLVL